MELMRPANTDTLKKLELSGLTLSGDPFKMKLREKAMTTPMVMYPVVLML